MRLDLTGFAPDLDPTTPGVVTDCDGIVPTQLGLAAANSLVNAGLPPLPDGPANNAVVAALLDGTSRVLVATMTHIYEAAGLNWVDRSRAGNYSGGFRTRFTVFGNNVLSTNRSEVIGQAVPGSGFTDITGAPQAEIIVTAAGFVMALDVSHADYGSAPDGWHCSALRDQSDWTAAAATQSAYGRLLDAPGDIRAGAALGSDVVAYKHSSMFLGRYVGPPVVWAWTRVAGDIGTFGNECVITIGSRHFFIGNDDIYVFDGTVPTPIGAPVKSWFFRDLNDKFAHLIQGVADLPRDLVYWHYPSMASVNGELDACLSYNIKTGKWGRQRTAEAYGGGVQAAVQYTAEMVTYDGLGSLYDSYEDLPNMPFDSPFLLSEKLLPGIITGNGLYAVVGTPGPSWLVTGDFGDLTNWSFLSRIVPSYRRDPATATLTNFHRDSMGADPVQDVTVPMMRKRFDLRRSARWHRVRLDHTGAVTINGLQADIPGATKE